MARFLSLIRFRTVLNTQNRSRESALLLAFGLLLLPLFCIGAHRLGVKYASFGLPIFPLVVAMVCFWIAFGFPKQLKSQRDKKWNQFIYQMPVSPSELFALHACAGLKPVLLVLPVMLSGLSGLGINLWTTLSGGQWPIIIVGSLWAIAIQVFCVSTVFRFYWTGRIVFLCLLMWVAILALRIVFAENYTSILSSDPVLMFSGVLGFANGLVAPNNYSMHPNLLTLAHIGGVGAGCAILSIRFLARLPQNTSPRSFCVTATTPLKKLLIFIIPRDLGGQVCLEYLRIMRSTNAYLTLYTLGGLLAIIALLIFEPHNDFMALIPLLAPVFMVSDGIPEILGGRYGNEAYDIFGADHRYYIVGFTFWSSAGIASICILYMTFLHVYIPASQMLPYGISIMATCLVLIEPAIVIDRLVRRNLLAGSKSLLTFAKLGIVLLIVPFLFLSLAEYTWVGFFVMVSLIIFIHLLKMDRNVIRKRHWRL